MRVLGIWIFGLLASGLAGGAIGLALAQPLERTALFVFALGSIAGLSAFACIRLWLAAPGPTSIGRR